MNPLHDAYERNRAERADAWAKFPTGGFTPDGPLNCPPHGPTTPAKTAAHEAKVAELEERLKSVKDEAASQAEWHADLVGKMEQERDTALASLDRERARVKELETTELEYSALCAQFRRQDKTLICHPTEAAQTINALRERVRTLEANLAESNVDADKWCKLANKRYADCAALRKDGERINELAKHWNSQGKGHHLMGWWIPNTTGSFRDSLDAARETAPGGA